MYINKAIDSDDEENLSVPRVPVDKEWRCNRRKFQNEVMKEMLQLLFKEHPDTILFKHTVIKKFNEASVPLTWNRLTEWDGFFEKKINMPPWKKRQQQVIMPLNDGETNVRKAESFISDYIISLIDKQKEGFSFPVDII